MYTQTIKRCEAHIAINHNRLKSYGENRYYLKDKTNFEIELFNPHTVSVLAKIKMNGVYISTAGLVIKPGQRIFLSRYIDTNNALLFETYEAEKNNETLEAIANNGKIQIEFYLEQSITTSFGGTTTWISTPNVYYTNNLNFGSSPYDTNVVYGNNSSITRNAFMNFSVPIAGSSDVKSLSMDSSMETGRIEKGEKTNQEMEMTYGSYSAWPTQTINLQLFPESIKPVEASEIRTYCTECGTRMKKSTWKFCPNCGTKIE